eukprot:scaffold19061_cov31-Tisochrysis_lutea.AAC.1
MRRSARHARGAPEWDAGLRLGAGASSTAFEPSLRLARWRWRRGMGGRRRASPSGAGDAMASSSSENHGASLV